MKRRQWIYHKPPLPKPLLSINKGNEIKMEIDKFIETTLMIKLNNSTTNIYSKRRRNYFYIISTHYDTRPNRILDTFEIPVARLELTINNDYNLSYMRYTGQWWEIHQKLTLNQCFSIITENFNFKI